MSTGYEVGVHYKGRSAPPNAGQGDVWVDQTTNEVQVHNGLRFASLVFPTGITISGGGLTVTGGVIISTGGLSVQNGAGAFAAGITFTGTAARLTGDMSNAIISSRLLFQTSTVNANTSIGVIPNGSATQTQLHLYVAADPDNAGRFAITASGSAVGLGTSKTGTGTEPTTLTLTSSAGTALSIATATLAATFGGNVGFNGTSAIAKPTVTGSRGANAALASLLTALANYGLITDSSS